MAVDQDTHKEIEGFVKNEKVFLFMKGSRTFPQCGFSASVVEILDDYLPDGYKTFNVLSDSRIREGIKEFSDWPTIPQLYINGEFVGGRDIVAQMHASGELTSLLGNGPVEVGPPGMSISDSAMTELMKAAAAEEHKTLRVTVTAQFQYGLSFAPKNDGDLEETHGELVVIFDRGSARRASGMSIDYAVTETGAGFKIENPNEPPKVKNITPAELKDMMSRDDVFVYDVRTPAERETAAIPSTILLDAESAPHLEARDKSSTIVFFCHHGGRSAQAADHFLKMGFGNVYNLTGGIDAWSTMDPSVPKY